MVDGEHFFSQLPSWLQTSQSSANFTVLRGTEISAPGCSCSLSEWCDLAGRYWPTTIRLFIGQSQLKRVMLVLPGVDLKPMILSLSAKQHSLPRSPSHLPEASLGLQKWNQQNAKTWISDVEKLWKRLWISDIQKAGDLPKLPWRAVSSLHLVVPWLGTPSWIGLSLSHPTRPCDAQKGHGWEHR